MKICRKICIHLQRKMNRLKKKMLLIISDDYSRNLTGVQNLRKKILVLCVASVCLRAHVMRVMLRGVIFHLYTARPWISSLCQPLRCVANTSSQLKGPWLVSESYTCADTDYLTCFLKEGYFLREKKGEIRSAEIRNCGGRKNDYIDMTLVIFCDIN